MGNNRYSYFGADVKCWAFFPGGITPDSSQIIGPGTQPLTSKTEETTDEYLLAGGDSTYKLSNEEISRLYKPQVKPVELDALHTISISISEPRGPARALGFRNIKGFARSVRTIAGSLIMTVIEDHPLRQLMEQQGLHDPVWSEDLYTWGRGSLHDPSNKLIKIPTMLPPFNIISIYMSEIPIAGSQQFLSPVLDPETKSEIPVAGGGTDPNVSAMSVYAGWLLEEVELIGEGMTTSVNDMVTEVMYQFVAQNYREFSANISSAGDIDPLKLDQILCSVSDEETLAASQMAECLRQEEELIKELPTKAQFYSRTTRPIPMY